MKFKEFHRIFTKSDDTEFVHLSARVILHSCKDTACRVHLVPKQRCMFTKHDILVTIKTKQNFPKQMNQCLTTARTMLRWRCSSMKSNRESSLSILYYLQSIYIGLLFSLLPGKPESVWMDRQI